MENYGKKHAELIYQTERALKIKNVHPTPSHIFDRYRKNKHWRYFPKEYVFKSLGDVKGKLICDYGCGEGVITSQLAKFGAQVTAIDISPDLIDIADRRAMLNGVRSRIEFIIGDVEKLNLPENNFDFLLAYEVLHHIDVPSVMPKIIASLKSGGKVIIVEPIACSYALQKLRNIIKVSLDGSSHDRQLNAKELKLISSYFGHHEMTFFRFFGRLERFFSRGSRIHRTAHLFLNVIDRFILDMVPPLWKFYGIVVIIGTKENNI